MPRALDAAGSGAVMTVQGVVDAGDLGLTLIHEHLQCDWTEVLGVFGYPKESSEPLSLATAGETRWNPAAHLDNYQLTEPALVASELAPFTAAGGRTVVDTTPGFMGRDPVALRTISQNADVHVIMGCGYYIEPHPPGLAERSADEITEELVSEIRDGVGEEQIRPGIIGEIGTGGPMTANEAKVLRAAAAAQRETGLPLTIHLHPWHTEGMKVLDIVEAEGGNLETTILNHVFTALDDDAYQRSLLSRGAYIGYDLFGFDHSLMGRGRWAPSDYDAAKKVVELAQAGHIDRLVISQDLAVKTRLHAFGGWGYDHLLKHVVPLLLEFGLDEEGVRTLLVDNPRRVLAGHTRPAS